MPYIDPDEQINPDATITVAPLACRLASEGIPVAAIARCVQYPSGEVLGTLHVAHAQGVIGGVPKFDWPPTGKLSDHLPQPSTDIPENDLVFAARKLFKLTPLEAAFLVVLLRCDHADKGRLHTVIENQRFTRAQNPDRLESTDPKMVDVMICKLRKRLKAADLSYTVMTVWGSGYYIEPLVQTAIMTKLIVECTNGKSNT